MCTLLVRIACIDLANGFIEEGAIATSVDTSASLLLFVTHTTGFGDELTTFYKGLCIA
ncbi:hypothetical protein [Nostoc sp.]|uniref:hypothetical protein n=1 Tax=Nostoc sp. TaxID=1180 RepID=UPI002FF64F6F